VLEKMVVIQLLLSTQQVLATRLLSVILLILILELFLTNYLFSMIQLPLAILSILLTGMVLKILMIDLPLVIQGCQAISERPPI